MSFMGQSMRICVTPRHLGRAPSEDFHRALALVSDLCLLLICLSASSQHWSKGGPRDQDSQVPHGAVL